MSYGWFIVVGSLFPIWIGYLVKFKGKSELIRIRENQKIRDKEGYIEFMGENMIMLGGVAAVIGVFMQFGLNEGYFGVVPAGLVVAVMLRMMKGTKNYQ